VSQAENREVQDALPGGRVASVLLARRWVFFCTYLIHGPVIGVYVNQGAFGFTV
jgi:hypothetical protein